MANQTPVRDDMGNIVAFKNADGTAATVPLNADGTLPVALGSGDGSVTIADGGDATQGAKADAAATTDTGTFSLVALVKRVLQGITSILTALAGAITVKPTGAAHFLTGQVNISTAIQVVGARATRRSVTVKNMDTSAKIYVGLDNTVVSTTGMELKAGESMNIDTVTAVFAIASTGTVVTAFAETYD